MVRSPIWSPANVLSNRNFLPPVVQHLPKTLLLALLVGTSGCSQQSMSNAPQATWKGAKAYLLGPGRHELMELCSLGGQLNSQGISAFNEYAKSAVQKKAGSAANADAYLAGRAAAMAVACPEVR